MSTENNETSLQVSDWSPELIIDLFSEIAWPIVVLILGWKFRGSISNAVSIFLNRNDVTEVSAGATGVTAKFKAAQQKAEITEENSPSNNITPIGGDYDSVVEKHKQQTTEFSDELYESIKAHLDALNIDDASKIDLLSKEASILQATLRFNFINQVLFRSQFDLFNLMPEDGSVITDQELQKYFNKVTSNNPEGFEGWDLVKYLSYPASIGMIEYHDNGYRLTKYGNSYIKHMRKNISLIDDLAKI